MSFHALIEGTVAFPPKEGIAASGKKWVSLGVRCKLDNPREGEPDNVVAQVIVFSNLADSVSDLVVGDAVSVAGACKVNLFDRKGETCAGLGIVADQIVHLRKPKPAVRRVKQRVPINAVYRDYKKRSANDVDDDFDDEITF